MGLFSSSSRHDQRQNGRPDDRRPTPRQREPRRPEYIDDPQSQPGARDPRACEPQSNPPGRATESAADRDLNGTAQPPRRRPRMRGAEAIQLAQQYIEQLTGRQPEAVSSLVPGKDGWRVTLDVVELERIPQTTDVIARYQIELDEEGELVCYNRVARYYRNQVDDV